MKHALQTIRPRDLEIRLRPGRSRIQAALCFTAAAVFFLLTPYLVWKKEPGFLALTLAVTGSATFTGAVALSSSVHLTTDRAQRQIRIRHYLGSVETTGFDAHFAQVRALHHGWEGEEIDAIDLRLQKLGVTPVHLILTTGHVIRLIDLPSRTEAIQVAERLADLSGTFVLQSRFRSGGAADRYEMPEETFPFNALTEDGGDPMPYPPDEAA